MTINKLASAIAKKEGKKSQVRIGDIREILGILADMIYKMKPKTAIHGVFIGLWKSGQKRSKLKSKTKIKL